MKKLIIFILVMISLTINAKTYNYVSIEGLIEQEIGRLIIPKIYEKLGIDVTITPFPGLRAQDEATSGSKDGEIMRIYTYGENNLTTVRVPTPYYYLETMGFVKKGSGIVINSKEDLKKYSLVKVRGVKHTDNITDGIDGVHTVNTTKQMMHIINAGRADIALTNTVDGLLVIKELGFENDIVQLNQPLATLDLYHYIYQDHSQLVDKVDRVIREMKKSGELAKVIKNAEDKIIASK